MDPAFVKPCARIATLRQCLAVLNLVVKGDRQR